MTNTVDRNATPSTAMILRAVSRVLTDRVAPAVTGEQVLQAIDIVGHLLAFVIVRDEKLGIALRSTAQSQVALLGRYSHLLADPSFAQIADDARRLLTSSPDGSGVFEAREMMSQALERAVGQSFDPLLLRTRPRTTNGGALYEKPSKLKVN